MLSRSLNKKSRFNARNFIDLSRIFGDVRIATSGHSWPSDLARVYAHGCMVCTVLARALLLRPLGWLLWPILFIHRSRNGWAGIALSIFYLDVA
jgi:hypothetical protein